MGAMKDSYKILVRKPERKLAFLRNWEGWFCSFGCLLETVRSFELLSCVRTQSTMAFAYS
jgi:hypothetical protein